MKEEGKTSKAPLTEAFGQWSNAKIALLALLGATAGEAVVWYGGQFYALFFLTQTIKVPAVDAQIMIAISLAIGTPCFILFGWLSDKIGRKPIMMAGFALAALTYFPIFQGITHFANPEAGSGARGVAGDRHRRSGRVLVPVQADRHRDLHHAAATRIKSALVGLSVNYDNVAAPKGTPASVKIGDDNLSGAARRRRAGRSRPR